MKLEKTHITDMDESKQQLRTNQAKLAHVRHCSSRSSVTSSVSPD